MGDDEMHVPRTDLLRSIPSLRHCTDEELARLAVTIREVDVPAGFVLERSPAHSGGYLIIKGWAAATVHGEPVAALGPGDFVGTGPSNGERNGAVAVAKTAMRLLVVETDGGRAGRTSEFEGWGLGRSAGESDASGDGAG